jgi:cyanophycinase
MQGSSSDLRIAIGAVLSLSLLALLPAHVAAQTPTAPRAGKAAGPGFQYWRQGNPQDLPTKTQAGFALIGGGDDLDDAFSWLCERSGGGDFLVLRARGTDAYNPYVHTLCHENSVATLLIPDRRTAFDEAVRTRIARASAIFISGGDQAKYVNYWVDTPVQQAVNDAIGRGVPVGGTSAGLAVQGEFMYSAQGDAEDGPDLSSALALQDPFLSRVTIVHNFLRIPALRDTITDTHFSARDRMGRLLVFMARILQDDEAKSIRAIAVDEHTAVLLEPDGRARIVGTGSVYFLRASVKASVCRPGTPLTFHGVPVIKLQGGATFDTVTWRGAGAHYELSVEQGKIHSTRAGGAIY